MNGAHDGLKLWLLLCSDLAIRSGTAARLTPANYNPEQRELHFTTKGGAQVTLPTTQELDSLIARCDPHDARPLALQLWPDPKPDHTTEAWSTGATARYAFARLRKRQGWARRVTPHDMRRATAVAIYKATGNLRDVQAALGHKNLVSTLHYLDHDLRPVRRSLLETIKRPAWAERKQA